MSEQLLHEFRDHVELLVRVPDLRDLERRGLRRRVRLATASLLVSGLVLAAAGVTGVVARRDDAAPAHHTPTETARSFLTAVGDYDTVKVMTLLADGVGSPGRRAERPPPRRRSRRPGSCLVGPGAAPAPGPV
jgi:hypothetical protein